MKKFWILTLTAALLFTFVGCMRGGNADEGNDGLLDDEDDTTRTVIDDIEDGLDDAGERVDDVMPDVDNGMIHGRNGTDTEKENGTRNDNRNKKDRAIPYDGSGIGNPYTNDNGNAANGGGLNGSGVTGNGVTPIQPRATIR
jgi:hypothetical protein